MESTLTRNATLSDSFTLEEEVISSSAIAMLNLTEATDTTDVMKVISDI